MQDLSPNKQALLKIRELKQQLADLQQTTAVSDPIAVVSMACRFPRRSVTPEAFWQSLVQQTDEVSEVPEDRWDLDAFYDDDPNFPGKMYARHGVFLDDLDLMDPEFFGISPREATWVDPQQRLLMEVGWEALERAGWTPEKIGDQTGIFVGWMHNDYQNEASDSFLNLNPYIATGAAGSFLCGRLAYYLGLQGPSVAVDTACSSSLVALHLACQSLLQRDCDRALVGGVNAIVSPTTNILTCKLKALSPTGQSRAFDAAADGYLRGEGCGVVTLRRLSDAERDGDRILGVICGSAIGHNGFSSGLTAPNPKAQEKVIRQALERAQLSPTEVTYLEAHGTGTELGDPIEMRAAAAALAADRSAESPLLVGSVKTNIGHLEAAAGMAGLIKVLLSLQHDAIPGQLNFENPNPHIAWDNTPVKVLTEITDWPDAGQRIAGVSAFGMSGTNAHVVVESQESYAQRSPKKGQRVTTDNGSIQQNEVDEPPRPQQQSAHLWTISGKSEAAIQELSERYARYLAEETDVAFGDLAYTSAVGRAHFEYRAALVVRDRDHALETLKTLSRSGRSESLFEGNGRRLPKVAWQFTGQGSQYVGMAQDLYNSEPVFREAIDHCDGLLQEWRGESLQDALFAETGKLDHTSWTQPGIFALQMGLAKLLESRGLRPDVVYGHSVGQYAAACVAGIMSWGDGLRLISERGRLIGALPSEGRMLAVFAPLAEVEHELKSSDVGDKVSIAALNGTHIVISGTESAVSQVEQRLTGRNIRCKPLKTSHAFHSSLMDPALDPFRQVANRIEFHPAEIPLICNVSGSVLDADRILDGNYWAQHIREAVRFSDCVETAQKAGCELILEVGPQSVLTRMAAANWKKSADRLVSCLQRDVADSEALLRAIGQLYVHGATPDFDAMYAGREYQRVLLPTYPFQRRRFWGPDKPRAFHAEFHTSHPLLGGKVALAGVADETRYESFIEPDSPPWLPDHEVMGQVVLPGAAYVEMALAAAKGGRIEEIAFEQRLQPGSRTALQTVVRAGEDGRQSIETYSSADSSTWTRNFKALLSAAGADKPRDVDRAALVVSCTEIADPADFYQKMQEVGLNYGPTFQTIQSLRYSADAVVCHLQAQGDIRGFIIPPTLLDGALHSLAVGLLREDDGTLFLPVGIGSVQCFQPVDQEVWCHAQWRDNEGKTRTADLTLFTESGQVVATINGLMVQQVSRAALRQMSGGGVGRLLYDLQWQSYRLPAETTSNTSWLIVGSANDARSAGIAHQLMAGGHTVAQLQRESCDHVGAIRDVATVSTPSVDSSATSEQSDRLLKLNSGAADHWDDVFEQLGTEEKAFVPDGIVWLCGGDEEVSETSSMTQVNCEGLLNLTQTLQRRDIRQLQCGLQLLTTDAISVDGTAACNAQQTQYWGLGRVIGAERPELRCRLIDTASSASEESTSQAVVEILLTETDDSQLAVRESQYFVPRMKPLARQKRVETELPINPDCSYLITGGLGMLGRQAAKWLSDNGATQVVLVSRRSPDESARTFLDAIESAGCETVVHATDISSRSDVEAMFQRFGSDLKPLGGVIHAAGVLDDALIGEQTWVRFEQVLAPKIVGAELLDKFTRSLPLDFFVLYSSVASVLGSPGQSNYATGNAYLDGLAWKRRAKGLPAISINWGPWSAGMAADERIAKRLALQGITPLGISEAHAAMEQLLTGDAVQATVIDVDWRRMRMGLGGESPAMLAGLIPARQQSQLGDSAFVGQLKRLQGNAQQTLLVKTIQEMLQTILSTPDAPETDRPLIEMGLDSLMAVEFSTQLQMMLGEQFAIGPTMLFDHPTIDAISAHVLEMVVSETETESPSTDAAAVSSQEPQRRQREPIAIVGMSCRFPGARNIDEFWENILQGVDSVCEIPDDRWDVDRYYDENREPGKMYSRQGGFLDDIGDFDAAFFNISEQEACWIDPQHRMLLENSYRALEDAGIATQPLPDANVGVFMGIMGQDYAFLPQLDDEEIIKAFQGAGLSHSAGVGRISYVFGFEGPSIAVDTASSSSLVALHQAVRSLQDGNCNLALAGGVNAILAPVNSLLMSKAGLLAPDGRCKSFSADADGFGRGEGCGVVVLKRLSEAERDGDRILAVVRGGAVVHNGFSGGITSPSGKAQARVISEALQDAEVAPSQVQYLEAHGTGTEFGDPMELGAAATVYGKGRNREEPLLVGSVKANISHLEAAGGVSGLIKTVLSMYHGIIPPQAHFDQPSPHIPWQRLPLKVVTETTPWPETSERLAGVTALGLVGTNAHVILSGAPQIESRSEVPEEEDVAVRPSHLLVMSGRNEEALTELALGYEKFLHNHPEADFADVCHTAAIGRRQYEHRLAIRADSREAALEKLAAVVAPKDIEGVSVGETTARPKIAWVFTGDRADPLESAQQLYAAEPVFRELISEFDDQLQHRLQQADQSHFKLRDWLVSGRFGNNGAAATDVHLFVLQAGLAHVWKSWGIEPDAVLGRGVGQYTAAAVAGGLSYHDALSVVIERELALQTLKSNPDDHSTALDQFEAFADTLNFYPPNLQLVCSLSGEIVPVHRSLGGSYWRRHLTDPVSPDCLQTLLGTDCGYLLEIGPHATMQRNKRDVAMTDAVTVLASVEQGRNITSSMLDALGQLYVAGINPDFASFNQHWQRKRLSLPHYPFQKKRYWITEVAKYLEPEIEAVSGR